MHLSCSDFFFGFWWRQNYYKCVCIGDKIIIIIIECCRWVYRVSISEKSTQFHYSETHSDDDSDSKKNISSMTMMMMIHFNVQVDLIEINLSFYLGIILVNKMTLIFTFDEWMNLLLSSSTYTLYNVHLIIIF